MRITAIRETFEELGVLICKHKEHLNDSNSFSHLVYDDFDVAHWQKQVSAIWSTYKQNWFRKMLYMVSILIKIHQDASKFLKLCEELNVVPDIWSLSEWSTWLTPTFKRDKRFYDNNLMSF